jgi:hypothetical protein
LQGATNHAAYRFEPALQPSQNQGSKLMGWITVKPEQEPEQAKGNGGMGILRVWLCVSVVWGGLI